MAPKKVGEGSKKAAGQARKAEAAAAKVAAEDAKKAVAEESDWKKGAKDSAKKYVACFFALGWSIKNRVHPCHERSSQITPCLSPRHPSNATANECCLL